MHRRVDVIRHGDHAALMAELTGNEAIFSHLLLFSRGSAEEGDLCNEQST
jgi:hypothetical protein